jgi:hypothetical protein
MGISNLNSETAILATGTKWVGGTIAEQLHRTHCDSDLINRKNEKKNVVIADPCRPIERGD